MCRFRRGDEISRSYLARIIGNHSLFMMWWIQGSRSVSQSGTDALSVHIAFYWLEGHGEGAALTCFLSMFSPSFNSVVLRLLLCPLMHVFRQPISVFVQPELCKKSQYLLKTPFWFGQNWGLERLQSVGGVAGVYSVVVKGLFLPVLSDISHGFMLCSTGAQYRSTVLLNPNRFVKLFNVWRHLNAEMQL